MSTSTVTSEALQLKLRQLLPSQQGFGTDLSASDTIIPIIDLTAAAEGSDVQENLQTALAFASQTVFNTTNTTDLLANTGGFWRIVGTAAARSNGGENTSSIRMSDGVSNKDVWSLQANNVGSTHYYASQYDLVVFLRAGDTVSSFTDSTYANMAGSIRQIADSNGTLVQPSGFTPE